MGVAKKTISTLSWSLMLSCLFACGQNKGSGPSSSSDRPSRKPTTDVRPGELSCTSGKVLEVLRDGKTAISMSKDDEGKIISWDVLTRKLVGEMYYPVTYHSVSPDGRYLLRKISFKKFQLILFGQGQMGRSRVININSINEPEVDFSFDSRYLLIKNTPFTSNLRDQVMIYDIENYRYLSAVEMNDIKYYALTRDAQFLMIAQDNGVNKIITKLEAMTQKKVWQIALPKFQRLTVMDIGEKAMIVKSGFKFYVFDLESGNKNYELGDVNYYGLSVDGNFGIFGKGTTGIAIQNLSTGAENYQAQVPSSVYLSSCRMDEEKRVMVCRHRTEHHKIVVWDLAASITTSSCI